MTDNLPFSPDFLAEIRARVRISEVVGRHVTWDRRKSMPSKSDYWACCPFHSEKTPSFHADDRRGRFYCFGCKEAGDIFSFEQKFSGLSFSDAVRSLAQLAGLSVEAERVHRTEQRNHMRARQHEQRRRAIEAQAQRDRVSKLEFAGEIWTAAGDATGTLVAAYLAARGVHVPPPPSLRFAPALKHAPSNTAPPAMVACMQGPAGQFAGVHRTWLKPDGSDKAEVKPSKMMLGTASGASIRFAHPAEHMYLAEGIENSMSVLQVRPDASVWAAGSIDNMARVHMPAGCRRLTLIADNDAKDWRNGRKLMRLAAKAHAARGLLVYTVWPPRGLDFNDVLLEGDAA